MTDKSIMSLYAADELVAARRLVRGIDVWKFNVAITVILLAAMCIGSSAPSSMSAVSSVMSAEPAMGIRKVSVRYTRLPPRFDLQAIVGHDLK
jgi:hypothetical protein